MPQLLINLGFTILLELPIVWIWLRREPWWQVVIFAVALNGFTLPLATYAYHGLDWNYFVVESLVFLVEAAAIWFFFRMDIKHCLLAAFLANGLSAAVGQLL